MSKPCDADHETGLCTAHDDYPRTNTPQPLSSTHNTEDEIDEIFEQFYQEYSFNFDDIHAKYIKGEITIEQQIEQSEIAWNQQLKQAHQALTRLMYKGMLDELTAEQFSSNPGYRLERIAELEALITNGEEKQ